MKMLSNYFKENKGFERLFLLLKDKYISLGRYSGSVQLNNITEKEAIAFTEFFGNNYKASENVTIRFMDITKCLQGTKYADFTWEKLFFEYFGEEILDRKSKKEEILKQEKEYFDTIKNNLTTEEQEFLDSIFQEKAICLFLLKRARREKKSFQTTLTSIIQLVCSIEKLLPTSLVMLASNTGNPHFLDFDTANNTLFIKLFSKKIGEKEPKTLYERKEFLINHGISLDEVSNYVITYKLRSSSSFVESFYKERQILNLNLSNLSSIHSLDTDEKFVIVLENPSLISSVKELDVPIVITSGIPNSSVYSVLQKLEENGNILYYNGDFDPEGLFIAEQVKKKVSSLRFFCYENEDYVNAKSHEMVTEARIHKLSSVKSTELQFIKSKILEEKKSGYQEGNIIRIKEFIKEIIDN